MLKDAPAGEKWLSERSRAVLQGIDASVVSLKGLGAVRGGFDRLFEQHEAVIVGRDRMVFGHTTNDVTLDTLTVALAVKLALIGDRTVW